MRDYLESWGKKSNLKFFEDLLLEFFNIVWSAIYGILFEHSNDCECDQIYEFFILRNLLTILQDEEFDFSLQLSFREGK